ncbi:lysophospholipid acyltransferase family protein [Psychromarinibacter sp. S121]|uniref:lysophospholipid acyltransferase family protein n=1 Tax=Psychromarinibacter sp. S121 TaxID=3415127 RepID=UPI003C7E4259
MQWIRSLIFVVQMYLAMAVLAVWYIIPAIRSPKGAYDGIHTYCRYVRWSARWLVGLKTEIRGPVPTDEVLIASKHQSFLDIIMLCSVLPRPKFIMKKELKWAPILGWFALRIGCVPVDRGKRGAAIARMIEDVEKGAALPGQLIIYPQGTRVAPGVQRQYKVGSAVLYEQLGQDCVPAATNVGLFWARTGIYRKPGLAVLEFLPRIEAGLDRDTYMQRLEAEVETASNGLLAEAGFQLEFQ